jgi:small-conductance mechanosensitive channel
LCVAFAAALTAIGLTLLALIIGCPLVGCLVRVCGKGLERVRSLGERHSLGCAALVAKRYRYHQLTNSIVAVDAFSTDSTISAFLQSATRILLRIFLLTICLSLLGVNS